MVVCVRVASCPGDIAIGLSFAFRSGYERFSTSGFSEAGRLEWNPRSRKQEAKFSLPCA